VRRSARAPTASLHAAASSLQALWRREATVCALISAAAAALVVAVVPPSGDTPAHLYRTLLFRAGAFGWDNYWYGGFYPFASYSLLYYPLAALVGNATLVAAAVVLAALLFASVATRAYGERAVWPARSFAILATAPLLLGQFPFGAGVASLLGTVRALQGGRRLLAAACAALTVAFSPLAFVFLCLVLVAIVLGRRALDPRDTPLAAVLVALAALQLLALTLFSPSRTYFFDGAALAGALAASGSGAVLAHRGRQPILVALFALWGVASVAAFVVPNPLGQNITRLRWFVFPLLLLAALVAGFRPRSVAAAALAVGIAFNLVPYGAHVRGALRAQSNEYAFWAPPIAFLQRHSTSGYRVEVVPTAAHWEAYYLPRAGLPLARGWYRQLDLADNRLLHSSRLRPRSYRRWLRSRGVRYVLLAAARLDTRGGEAEAALLRSGLSGLTLAAQGPHWSIYELPAPTPILTGPDAAGITRFQHARIAGWTRTSGRFRLRVRFNPYWRVAVGAVDLERAPDGATVLDAARPGRFVLVAEFDLDEALRTRLDLPRRLAVSAR
jgi:hypothetical protein